MAVVQSVTANELARLIAERLLGRHGTEDAVLHWIEREFGIDPCDLENARTIATAMNILQDQGHIKTRFHVIFTKGSEVRPCLKFFFI